MMSRYFQHKKHQYWIIATNPEMTKGKSPDENEFTYFDADVRTAIIADFRELTKEEAFMEIL